MNKYETKLFEIVKSEGTIHELIRRPVRSRLLQIVDMFFDNILFTADGLSSKGAYFLRVDETEAELIHIDRDLKVTFEDVTNAIKAAAHKKTFEFADHKYKLIKKIR